MDFPMKDELLPGLPPYAGGRMSDTVYNAGVGLHGQYNDGACHSFTWRWSEKELNTYAETFLYFGYRPSAPFVGQDRFDVTLSNGASAFRVARDGAQLTVQQCLCAYADQRDEPCLLRTVTETDAAAFGAYLDALKARGFAVTWRNRIEENLFCELTCDQRRIYAAFWAQTGVARFIDERVGVSVGDFGGGQARADGTLDLCQFGLYYSYMRPCVSADCGMLYLLKLPDDSLFVVDGGEIEQATDAACAEALRMMRQMSKTPAGEKIPVAAWFCTHAHNDHMDLFGKLMRFHHDEMDVRRAIFNFPANENYQLMPQTYFLLERLNQYYPGLRYLKAHAGQRFELAGVSFEVLLTHEDNTGAAGNETIGGFNDTSTILRVAYDGVTFLILGDMDQTSESVLLAHYTEKTLRCTALQAAHHLINRLDRAYPVMAPQVALVPQHIRKAIASNENYQVLLRTVPAQNQYYASCATDVFHAAAGRLTLAERYPIEGSLFDHSQG